jgi:serine/threonine protein kinase/Flp pilus assembly protein TadD
MNFSSESPTEPLSERDAGAEALFYEALELAPSEREAFLQSACGSDEKLRAVVEGYLEDHQRAGAFLLEDAPASAALEFEFARLKPEEIGDRIGPYQLLELIGEGGCGRIWVAEQQHPIRRRVALKIIKLGMDTKEVIARFEQERHALAVMDHPNIARVLDAGATPLGRPFFVMELVRGVKITDYCDEAAVTTKGRLEIFLQVCKAVQHAHQKGVIHRDLKPSNVLVTLHDGVPVAKVIDFGVAKATEQRRLTDLTVYTRFEQMIGTPLYMAPEQAEMSGLDIDTRSDIYSLGVLLYELLTGRTPFDPEKLMSAGFDEIRRVIREEEPPTPSTFLSTMQLDARGNVARRRSAEDAKLIAAVRGDLDWIVMKALEKDRNRRFETANEFARDIERHLANEPVHARPPSAGYRLRRFVTRNRLAVAAGTAVTIAIVVGVAGIAWQALRAEREARRATSALAELRKSAPAFAEHARVLIAREQFDEALERLGTAMKLQPDAAEYALEKANLLQSQFRFDEARALYLHVLRIDPGERRAKSNAPICEKLGAELREKGKLSRESLAQLLDGMLQDGRPTAEMMKVSRLLGKEKALLLAYWLDRLKELPISTYRPLSDRLKTTTSGQLSLDLTGARIEDLGFLRGMPLEELYLNLNERLRDLSPIEGMTLHTLEISGTDVTDLTPLRGMATLKRLMANACGVSDLSPLQDSTLTHLQVNGTRVADLLPLKGLPLRELFINGTKIRDLSPLSGAPLRHLQCWSVPVADFSPIVNPALETLEAAQTQLRDLSFLKGQPLKILDIRGCVDVRGFSTIIHLPALEELRLPKDAIFNSTAEDFEAIKAIAGHGTIRQVLIDEPSVNAYAALALTREEFARYIETVRPTREAESHARAGRYHEATAPLRELKKTATVADPWIGLGAVLMASGNVQGFAEFCEELLVKYEAALADSKKDVPPWRGNIVKIACLSPTPPFRAESLAELMNFPIGNSAWNWLAEAMRRYRAGDFKRCLEIVEKIGAMGRNSARDATAGIVGSMAMHRSGKTDEAKVELARAGAVVRQEWPEGRAYRWVDWLVAEIWLREAEALILGAAQPSDQ